LGKGQAIRIAETNLNNDLSDDFEEIVHPTDLSPRREAQFVGNCSLVEVCNGNRNPPSTHK